MIFSSALMLCLVKIKMRNFLFGMLFIGGCATSASALVTEQIIAVVNGQLIFQTDASRNQTFFEQGPDVENLINHKLLLMEAKRFVLSPPESEEVDLAFEAIRRKFPDASVFDNARKETGFTIEDFKREILDRLWVKKLIQDRITFFIFITDEEIAQYYQNHQNDFGDKKRNAVLEEIRVILEKEREEIKIKEYLARIKSQANIEVNVR